jgi:two-component system response regulator NreC
MTKTRIVVADDHGIVRKGLRFILERQEDMEVAGEAADGRGSRPGRRGTPAPRHCDGHCDAALEWHRCIHADSAPQSANQDRYFEHVCRRRISGASADCGRQGIFAERLGRTRSGAGGTRSYIGQVVFQSGHRPNPRGRLRASASAEQGRGLVRASTEREREVLQLLAEGHSNKEVATLLKVSPYTAETHRMHLMQKLNLHNTAEIVLYAVRKKIIS